MPPDDSLGGHQSIHSTRWDEITRLVDAALDLEEQERDAFLNARCAGDLQLLTAAQRMLRACTEADHDQSFLRRSAGELAASLADDLAARYAAVEAAVPATLDAALRGHYTVQRELGRGGMAAVYLARDERHRRDVAIKVLRPDLAKELGAERFLLEIEIAASLQHQNILPVFDSGDADGLLYYIMPFVAGESLRERLDRERQLPITHATRIARDVANALDYAHAHGVIHRDIKPGNVLLDGERALVADFGVARAVAVAEAERLTGSGIAIGTTRYMSPEQGAGDAKIDGRSDVYSLACVLFEMLTGEPPFTGPTAQATIAKHLHATIPDARILRPTLSGGTQEVLAQALAKMPADRFTSAGQFVTAFETSLIASTVQRRRRRLVATGTAVLAVPAMALLWYVLDDPTDGSRHDEGLTIEPPRIAVLYFDDLTPDSSLRHIADGLTEELIYELSGVNAFRIVSKGGVRQFRNRQVPFDSIVGVLKATTVVDGSLQRAGEEVRVIVQLIDARTNTNVDRISIQRPLSEFLTLEREVAQQVAIALRRRMGREVALRNELTGTSSSLAAELVLKARRFREDAAALAEHPHPADRKTTLEMLDRADSLLALAQAEDPSWVRPVLDRGWIAHDRLRLLRGGARHSAGAQGFHHAEEALRRVTDSAEALELRGTLRWSLARGMDSSSVQAYLLQQAATDVRSALDRDSTLAAAWATLSQILIRQAAFAEADLAAERALREDAYLAGARDIYEGAFYSAVWNRNLTRAAEWCQRGRLSFPGNWRFIECELTLMRENFEARPDADRAWKLVAELDRAYPVGQATMDGNRYSRIYWRVVAAALSTRAGRPDIGRAELARARQAAAGDSGLLLDLAYDEAYLRLALGEPDQAERLLNTLVAARPGTQKMLARDPLFLDLPLPSIRDTVSPEAR